MDYSRSIKTETRKSNITVSEKVFADLMVMGWRESDAYVAAFGMNVNYSDEYHKAQMRVLQNKPDFAKYLRARMKKMESSASGKEQQPREMTTEEALSMATKEETIKALMIAKEGMKVGSKEWIDTMKMIADLQQMKKSVVEEEDNTVHYYLPLSCNNCSLFINSRERKRR